jgi:hypothetical protein
MYPAMVLMLLFVALLAVIHEHAPQTRKAASLFSLCVGVVAAAVILIDYFIQVTVMQPSLEKRQYDGWALFTQYNPNGIFIALEELGYLLMTVSLVGLAPVFSAETRLSRAIRWLFVTSFSVAVIALAAVSVARGSDRGDAFEIAVITVVWLTLIVTTPLLAVTFRRAATT